MLTLVQTDGFRLKLSFRTLEPFKPLSPLSVFLFHFPTSINEKQIPFRQKVSYWSSSLDLKFRYFPRSFIAAIAQSIASDQHGPSSAGVPCASLAFNWPVHFQFRLSSIHAIPCEFTLWIDLDYINFALSTVCGWCSFYSRHFADDQNGPSSIICNSSISI